MLKRAVSKLSYANVVGTLALFVALGGTTFAATQLHGSQIKPGTVTGKQIRSGSVPGADLRRNSVTGKQVMEAKLGTVPRAKVATVADRAALADRAAVADRSAIADSAKDAARATSAATADTATIATDSQRLGGLPGSDYVDHCEVGTRAYAGVCIETTSRAGATWPVAARICGDAGGRLPSLGELEGFRQQPGITLGAPEHTSTFVDNNWIDPGGEYTIGLYDNGTRAAGFAYGSSSGAYRCVKPMSNL